jgi:hypothetical protein
MSLTDNERECIRAAVAEHDRTMCGWRPWNGFYGCAKRLAEKGHLKAAGICAMPPGVLYIPTDKGRKAVKRTTQSRKHAYPV